MHGILLLLHVVSATVWTGGHLVLATAVLPRVLRSRDPSDLVWFEAGYERIGMPALAIQVATGVLLAYDLEPDIANWFVCADGPARLITMKLGLLALTAVIALDARLRVIPRLDAERLTDLAWHVVPVTALSVLFVVVGVSFRNGWY